MRLVSRRVLGSRSCASLDARACARVPLSRMGVHAWPLATMFRATGQRTSTKPGSQTLARRPTAGQHRAVWWIAKDAIATHDSDIYSPSPAALTELVQCFVYSVLLLADLPCYATLQARMPCDAGSGTPLLQLHRIDLVGETERVYALLQIWPGTGSQSETRAQRVGRARHQQSRTGCVNMDCGARRSA